MTGHSKGGALAHALALWLADTRDAGAEPAWDSRRLATVRCFSYGAPTIGDAGFAEHATTVLGDDLHRIVNPLDVVPHTWSVDDLTRIGGLYGDLVEPMPPGDLIEQVGAGVQQLAYRHAPARETTTLPSTLDPDRRSFVDDPPAPRGLSASVRSRHDDLRMTARARTSPIPRPRTKP